MGVSKKRRRKIVRNGRTFWWCVKPNDDTYAGLLFTVDIGLYTNDANTLLSIVSDDKKFIVNYHLNQRNEESKIVTPYLVAQIIDWCLTVEGVTPVDYLGNILGLRLAGEKTKILEFGRFAKQNRERSDEGKPVTFDFLGFTFYCSTDSKKTFFRCKVKAMKDWIKSHRTLPLEEIFKTINGKLKGHYQYYAVTDNIVEVKRFLTQTKWLIYKWLNRRSQRKSYTTKAFFDGLL